jgi:hypothetical protein
MNHAHTLLTPTSDSVSDPACIYLIVMLSIDFSSFSSKAIHVTLLIHTHLTFQPADPRSPAGHGAKQSPRNMD